METGHEDEFIDINLDDVDSQKEPMPDGPMLYRVIKVEKKHKEGKEYPYINVTLQPQDDRYNKRRYFLILTYHPTMLFQMKQFAEACKVKWTSKGFALSELRDKLVYVSSTIKDDENSAGDKINELGRPFNAA